MSKKTLFNSSIFRKAFALIGVYAIHLVCFQILMQAAPGCNSDSSFKPLFTHHQKSHNNNPPKHPAVTYYTQLVKQGKDVRGIGFVVAPVMRESDLLAPATPSLLSFIYSIYQAGLLRLHLADDTFRLYRLLHVFLI